MSGVQTRPGATAFIRIPLLTKLFASARVKPTFAPSFAKAIAAEAPIPLSPPVMSAAFPNSFPLPLEE
jgi:hypothetical protein